MKHPKPKFPGYSLSDLDILQRLGEKFHAKAKEKSPFLTGSIIALFVGLLEAASLSVKVFLRRKLGSRKVGLAILFFAFLWIRFFIVGGKAYGFLWHNALQSFEYFFSTFLLWAFNPYIGVTATNPDEYSLIALYYSYVALLLGLAHLFSSAGRTMAREKWLSDSQGESVFFQSLKGKFIGKVEITDMMIFMYFEPLLLVLTGFLVDQFIKDSLFFNLMLFSAIALFLDEYRRFMEFRANVIEVIDGELQAKKLMEELEKYDRYEKAGNIENADFSAGVQLATETDIQHSNKQKNEAERQEARLAS